MKKQSSAPKKWLRILLPSMFIVGWLALAGIGGPYFGKISEQSSTDLATFLPASAEATKVNDQLDKFRDEDTIPVLVVFSDNGKQISDDTLKSITDVNEKLANLNGVEGKISPPVESEDGQAVFTAIPLESDADFKEVFAEIKSTLDEAGAFEGIDGTLLFVALAVVFIILLVAYRSPLLPFIVLFTSMAALSVAILVVYYLAANDIVQLNGQVQGILFILVIGAATDYSLLYVARYREELTNHDRTWHATLAAVKSSVEPIIAAGGTVIAGLLCLLVSDLGSNKALGPVGSVGIIFSITAALTFLPALLLAFGRTAFWPRRPKHAPDQVHHDYQKNHPVWNKVGQFVQRHPRRIWVSCTVILALAFVGVFQLKAEGVSQSELILGKSEARDGQKVLDAHFPSGSGAPAFVVVSSQSIDRAVMNLEKNDGVDSVSVIATGTESGSKPLSKEAAEITADIRYAVEEKQTEQLATIRGQIESQLQGLPDSYIDQAYESAIMNVPSVDELVEQANPFRDAEPKIVDGNSMLQVTLTDAASSLEARQTIVELREEIRTVDKNALVGGTSAAQYDTNQAALRDERVIIPLILIAITIILMLLLRSIVAPLLLLLTTVLSFGATLGVAAFLFNDILQFPGADPAVIIFGFVFLVALGIDYNIFLMTRVREETAKVGVAKGTIKGLVVTGGVITSAGIVLAATFAALSVIPILFLVEIAFIVAFGVLLDTIIVRSLLVPALTLEVGRAMWWPSALWGGKK